VRARRTDAASRAVLAFDLDEVAEVDTGAGQQLFHRSQFQAFDHVVCLEKAVPA